jgi:hypothetical protein
MALAQPFSVWLSGLGITELLSSALNVRREGVTDR